MKPCLATGSRTAWFTAGVITMKMISSTRTMSTSGVTLMSAFIAPDALARLSRRMNSSTIWEAALLIRVAIRSCWAVK